MNIGGNMNAVIQIKQSGGKNEIGERVTSWIDVLKLHGWLDFMSGEAKYLTYNAKIQESSHLFICDYEESIKNLNLTSENARMIIDGVTYDIVLVDDPMNLHQHYEFYLKAVGVNG